jgi:hypothetical protein
VWTPLSATARVKNGKATFVLEKMPDNLGTFRVAALATDGAAYGSGETSLVSRLEYNVEPSLPRIARVGDRFWRARRCRRTLTRRATRSRSTWRCR